MDDRCACDQRGLAPTCHPTHVPLFGGDMQWQVLPARNGLMRRDPPTCRRARASHRPRSMPGWPVSGQSGRPGVQGLPRRPLAGRGGASELHRVPCRLLRQRHPSHGLHRCADPASTCVCTGGGWVSVASLSVCEGVGPHRPAHAPSCIQSIQGHTLESPDRVCVSWVRGGGQSLEGGHHHTMDQ